MLPVEAGFSCEHAMWTPCILISPAFLCNEAIFCLRITTLLLGATESFYCLSVNLFCNKCIIQYNNMILDSKFEHDLAFQPIHLEIRRQNLNCLSWRYQKSRLKPHAPPCKFSSGFSHGVMLHIVASLGDNIERLGSQLKLCRQKWNVDTFVL